MYLFLFFVLFVLMVLADENVYVNRYLRVAFAGVGGF